MSPPRTNATVRPSGDQAGCAASSGRTTLIPDVGERSASRPLAAAAMVGVVAGGLKNAAAGRRSAKRPRQDNCPCQLRDPPHADTR